jgi:hypothetical protein
MGTRSIYSRREVGLLMPKEIEYVKVPCDSEYPIGWIATYCSCGQALTFELEHVYGVYEGDTSEMPPNHVPVPSSYTHGECPICKKVINLRIEVWE